MIHWTSPVAARCQHQRVPCALGITIRGPSDPNLPPWPWIPASDIWLPRPETCSNMFTLGPCSWCGHLVATQLCTVGGGEVCILLECFLVWNNSITLCSRTICIHEFEITFLYLLWEITDFQLHQTDPFGTAQYIIQMILYTFYNVINVCLKTHVSSSAEYESL